MNTSKEVIRQATRLYLLGQKIHKKQTALGKLVDVDGFSTERVITAHEKLEKLLNEFIRLEKEHLAYREEYIRQREGTPVDTHRPTGKYGRIYTEIQGAVVNISHD